MKVIPQEISAVDSSMSVEYSKICCFFPINTMFGLTDIQNDCHSVLVILSNRPLIGRSSIGLDIPIRIFRMLRWLKVADGHQDFRKRGVRILITFEFAFLRTKEFWLEEDFLSDDLILLFDGGFRFGARLIFVIVFRR